MKLQQVRESFFQAVVPLKFRGKVIPVFDEVVNPDTVLPVISGAECYVLLQDQQEMLAGVQNYCGRLSSDITIKVVTKFQRVGSKKLCEDIGKVIDSKIREGRENKLGFQKVTLSLSRTLVEESLSNVVYQLVLIYSNNLGL